MLTKPKDIKKIVKKAEVREEGQRITVKGFVSNIELKKLISLVEKNGENVYLSPRGYLVIHDVFRRLLKRAKLLK